MDPLFDTVQASQKQVEDIKFVRSEFDALLKNLEPALPLSGRYAAIVRTKLEEACMFAVKGVLVR